MRQVDLGRTGIKVSELCLGTMTWGSQNTEAEGHAQMDLALDRGVNFWDTAEMYPVNPVKKETAGRTEAIIGSWLASRGGRDRLVLATKVAGPNNAIRDGEPTAATMRQALEASLKRLKTDYVDLYQIHWPNRPHYHFRNNWTFAPKGEDRAKIEAHMIEILELSRDLIAEGKIRAIALSNETVWGAARWLSLAEKHGLPRMASVQNEYSLMCRQFDTDWAELSVMEEMPLLAFSPLATGILSGKYQGDATPPGSRRSLNPTLGGRMVPRALQVAQVYLDIAARNGLDPCQMAIAFCLTRPFPTIPIVGATSVAQLATNLTQVTLSPQVLAEIEAAHRAHPQPY